MIEALVASGILVIGITAAASMSLQLLTQEEINERTVRAFNYLDNAARLYQLGLDPNVIDDLLPEEPVVTSFTTSSRTVNVGGLDPVVLTRLTIEFKPTASTKWNGKRVVRWTGGHRNASRVESIEVMRSSNYLSEPLSRVNHFR